MCFVADCSFRFRIWMSVGGVVAALEVCFWDLEYPVPVFVVYYCGVTAMLVLAHPQEASSSGYCAAADVGPTLNVAFSKILNSRQTLVSATPQGPCSSLLQPAPLTIPVYPPQLHVQPGEVLPAAVQGCATLASGSVCPSATVGVSGLLPCAPAVVGSGLLHQTLLPQAYISQQPTTVPTPSAPSTCDLPPAKACGAAANKASKDRQRLLKKNDCVQRGWSDGLCEREDKLQQQYASTVDQRQKERQQRDQQQQPPLWRVPVVRDPLANAAADFNPTPISTATLVRHLWKHAHAAVEVPTSTPPFRWIPSLTQPHPSYWTDLRQYNRRPAHEQLAQHRQGRKAGDGGGDYPHQYMHSQCGFRENAGNESAENDLRRTTEGSIHRSLRRRSSSTASRLSHKQSSEDSDWQTKERAETTTQYGDGDEDEEQSTVLSTRVGRSQSPAYLCSRKDDFAAEQLIDAPAYVTNHIGLLSDTGMHYRKRYELPTLSRFLQAKHPVFLRARKVGDERPEQSRHSSRDALRTQPSRSYSRGEREEGGEACASEGGEACTSEGGEACTSEGGDRHAAGGGLSFALSSVSPVGTPAAILLQPQTHLQPEQNQIIIPAPRLPTILWPPQANPGALAQQESLEFTGTDTGRMGLQSHKSTMVPTVTTVTEKSFTTATAPLCAIPQPAVTCLQTAVQPRIVCPGSKLFSLQSGPTFAAPLCPPSLYAHAPIAQQNSAQMDTQSTPEPCSSTATVHSAFQAPHTTVYAVAPPLAHPAVAVEAPHLVHLGPEAQTAASVPGNASISNPLSTQCSSDIRAAGTCSAVDHTREAERPPQPQQHQQRVDFESQEQAHERQQPEDTSEGERGGSIQKSEGQEEPGRQQPSQQQHTARDFQPEAREQFSPQRHVVIPQPQSDQGCGSSCQATTALPGYPFPREEPRFLLTRVAGVAPPRLALCSTPVLPRAEISLCATEANSAALRLPVAQDVGGICALGTLSAPQTTATLLAGSPLQSRTSVYVPQVSTIPGICHSPPLLPAEGPRASVSASHPESQTKVPRERHREASPFQWEFLHHSLMTGSPVACVATPVATSIPTIHPTAHVLLQQQQWHPQVFIPPSAVAGPG